MTPVWLETDQSLHLLWVAQWGRGAVPVVAVLEQWQGVQCLQGPSPAPALRGAGEPGQCLASSDS